MLVSGQTHPSTYSSIFNCLRDIGQKLQLFPTPLAFNAPFGVFPLEFRENVWFS